MSLYDNWRNMHRRCSDPSYHAYHRYGGRGITVCDRWADFANFKADLEDRYSEGLTLDRTNNDGPYSPDNCEWKPKAENTKTLLVDPQELLKLYEAGTPQKTLASQFNTDQPHISRILARGRRVKELQKLA